MDFANKTVVVTGGTGALGTAVVGALLQYGARCVVPYVHEAEMARFAHRDHKSLTLVAVRDLSDEADVGKLYAQAGSLWASIHIAGGFAMGKVADTDKAALMAQIDQNLVSCFLCCRAAVKAFGANGGRIVNVAARPALEWRAGAGMSAYAIAKAGVAVLTTTLAEEAAKDGVLVNAVAPSIMDTAANRAAMPKTDHAAWPKVEEVAATIVFLASPDNRVTRGAVVPVYGKA
ncbi:MAG TPA: SDR family NAD(P)-dependent oxidoreductase [Pseudolabrys sp.]|uniref:SDR family NAD(P)-dependent oxidoreductase n=1 Tax=Pseudolabrys sp. TaxID=1960880 RepID=UPI002DDCD336|nr:SDR family NAD(P)-dependent oxidoreductase [Pseudolabrys sp.]HEV2629479.1 SDR family NAD(P)-dependent oxidoreductase [Pseudolabrys sp.]